MLSTLGNLWRSFVVMNSYISVVTSHDYISDTKGISLPLLTCYSFLVFIIFFLREAFFELSRPFDTRFDTLFGVWSIYQIIFSGGLDESPWIETEDSDVREGWHCVA